MAENTLNLKNMMNIVILDGYASNPGDLNWDLLVIKYMLKK